MGAVSAAMISLPAQAETNPIDKREGDAHNHHFYSAEFANPDNVIVYVVCNQTDAGSDFFWAKAAFGVGENNPIPAHTCLERNDYIDGSIDGNVPKSKPKTSEVYVKAENGEIPTLIWCDYLTFNRCDNNIPANIASWVSELRMFGEGASNRLTPIIKAGVRLTDGKYKVQIEYSEAAGSIVVVALNANVNTASFQNSDSKDIGTSKAVDVVKFDDSKIQADLHKEDPVLLINNGNSSGKFEFYLSPQGDNATSLSFIGLRDGTIRFRFDSIQLSNLAR
ncbi:hypothetical protein [Rhizobium sp. WYCCWR 11128]|uniref:hypothetical protein n=1 Tax=Rhizobium sp. WYCCWR 11128 TaxID=2749832 RepID=UPI0015D0EEE3|nr:hypothetical protein [Rhizobium sp. WYCCWR 11128]NYT29333.1 hypothetical protein [Rhizobium sp. WYCCWR 11128]